MAILAELLVMFRAAFLLLTASPPHATLPTITIVAHKPFP
jgi:hypothetical protein